MSRSMHRELVMVHTEHQYREKLCQKGGTFSDESATLGISPKGILEFKDRRNQKKGFLLFSEAMGTNYVASCCKKKTAKSIFIL